MTWMHWVLFSIMSVFALGLALDKKSGSLRGRLGAFVVFVVLILLLVLGQPK